MRIVLLALAFALAGCVGPASPTYENDPAPDPAMPSTSPYAGQEVRELKALSADEIQGYRSGAGLGYAKPAELNSYPGPLHALEMAERLGLTDEQKSELTRIREEMLAQAIPLGERYLVVESAIEQGFRDGALDEATLASLLDESADIEAKLRLAHLAAHLETKALLTQHQVALYDEARGYAAAQRGADAAADASSGEADHDAHGHEM